MAQRPVELVTMGTDGMTSDSLVLVTARQILDVLLYQQVGLKTHTHTHTMVYSDTVVVLMTLVTFTSVVL